MKIINFMLMATFAILIAVTIIPDKKTAGGSKATGSANASRYPGFDYDSIHRGERIDTLYMSNGEILLFHSPEYLDSLKDSIREFSRLSDLQHDFPEWSDSANYYREEAFKWLPAGWRNP